MDLSECVSFPGFAGEREIWFAEGLLRMPKNINEHNQNMRGDKSQVVMVLVG